VTSDSLLTIAYFLIGGAAGLWILIALAGSLPLLALSKVYLEPTSDEESHHYLQQVLSLGVIDTTWASENNFEPVGVYRVKKMAGSPILVGWKKSHERTYLCIYVLFETHTECDCVSIFEKSVLTTGTSKDGQMIPSKHDWMQTFNVTDMEELWEHHFDTLEYLKQTLGQTPLRDKATLAEDFEATLHQQAEYISLFSFWPLRVPYWYFVRRAQRHNKPLRVLLGDSA